MKHLRRLLCSLIFVACAGEAQAQRRAIMEGLAANNTAIYISTPTSNLYVLTAGTMAVNGNAFSVGVSSLVVAGGKVGVGTTSPGAPLDVSGTSGGYIQKWSSGTAAGQSLVEITYNAAGAIFRAGANKALGLGSGESTNFTIPVGGATAGGALCLNGSNVLAKCTSAIDASGNCTCP